MLKITRVTSTDRQTLCLRLDGQVAGPWVETLRRTCRETGPGGYHRHLQLDLSGVSFIDAGGVALFRELLAHDAELTNGSVYVAEQLKEVAHGTE